MGNMELLSILVATFTGMLSTIFLMINRSSARKNSNESEKILFELKQVNDEVSHKIQETIEKTNSNQHGKSDRSKIVNNKSNEKLDQLMLDRGLAMTYRQWIHAMDSDIYGEFQISDECLNKMSDQELTEFVARLEQMTVRNKFGGQ